MQKCHWCGKANPEFTLPYNGTVRGICQKCVNDRTPELKENVDTKELLLESK
jgi:hypothetical protein